MKLKLETPPLSLLVGIAALGLIVLAAGGALAAETAAEAPADPSTETTPVVDDDPQPALQAGRVVHIDPQTRRKTLPTAAQRAAGQAQLSPMMSRSSLGLVETASPSSGVMVNLLGRFRHASTMTVTETGDVASECSATVPQTTEEADHE